MRLVMLAWLLRPMHRILFLIIGNSEISSSITLLRTPKSRLPQEQLRPHIFPIELTYFDSIIYYYYNKLLIKHGKKKEQGQDYEGAASKGGKSFWLSLLQSLEDCGSQASEAIEEGDTEVSYLQGDLWLQHHQAHARGRRLLQVDRWVPKD